MSRINRLKRSKEPEPEPLHALTDAQLQDEFTRLERQFQAKRSWGTFADMDAIFHEQNRRRKVAYAKEVACG